MYPFTKTTKRRRTENASHEPGCWDNYQIGRSDNATSLPVDYCLIGFLAEPLKVGEACKVMRVERNGITVRGVFESTPIQELFDGGFVTQNSVYNVEPIELISYLAG